MSKKLYFQGLDVLGARPVYIDQPPKPTRAPRTPSAPTPAGAGLAAAIKAATSLATPSAASGVAAAVQAALTTKPGATAPGGNVAATGKLQQNAQLATAKKNAIGRMNSTAQKLQSAAARLAKKKPQMASKLVSAANKLQKKATTIVGHVADYVACHIVGDASQAAADTGALMAAVNAGLAASSAGDAIVTLADMINDQVLPGIDQATAANQTDLVTSGNSLYDRASTIMDQYNAQTGM